VRLARTLRAVAVYEALKGIVVLLTGVGMVLGLHRDIAYIAERIIAALHVNPTSRFARMLLSVTAHVTSSQLWAFAGFTAVYALLRFAMAYGLWLERRWAEWLVACSAAIYLPLELYELFNEVTWIMIVVIVANVLMVALMAAALHYTRPAVPANRA
jgi:uncharacterized membrane protein (DUF2068 family)